MSVVTEYQYLYITTSAYFGLMEAKLRGEKVPKDAWDKAQKLFQKAIAYPYLRFKERPTPHYDLDDVLELLSLYFDENLDMSNTLFDLVAKEELMKERKELEGGVSN